MSDLPMFEPFRKIGRLAREIIVTEKIDGTNGVIYIGEDGQFLTGSRSQWITPATDNHGFSRWAHEHRDELMDLGPGTHYGEWWGSGIQRRYGLAEKRFSLFNTLRWGDGEAPSCCHVVPVLYQGEFETPAIAMVMAYLAGTGSKAAPGFKNPEGIVIYHRQANVLFKKTFVGDDAGKGRDPLSEGP